MKTRRAQRRKFHYIYKTVCLITGRYYIGMHSSDSLYDGYLGSGKQLWNSIKKYGRDHHRREVLELFESREALRRRETELVNDDLLKDEMCMNISRGGEGGWDFVNEHGLGGPKDPSVAGRKGGLVSGRKHRAEHLRGFWSGRHHTDEAKLKKSLAMLGKQDGKRNSQFGTRWMIKDGFSQKFRIAEIELMLKQGWKFGRK